MQQYLSLATNMPIKSRKQALEAGDKFYWTGKACKHGHRSVRFVSIGQCAMCQRSHADNFRSAVRKAHKRGQLQAVTLTFHPDDGETLRQILLAINPIQQYRAALMPGMAQYLTVITDEGAAPLTPPPPKKSGGLSPNARRAVIPQMPDGLDANTRMRLIAEANGMHFDHSVQDDGAADASRRMQAMIERELGSVPQ